MKIWVRGENRFLVTYRPKPFKRYIALKNPFLSFFPQGEKLPIVWGQNRHPPIESLRGVSSLTKPLNEVECCCSIIKNWVRKFSPLKGGGNKLGWGESEESFIIWKRDLRIFQIVYHMRVPEKVCKL